MMLSHAATRQPATLARCFSYSHRMLEDSRKAGQGANVRVNPLVGNYTPAPAHRTSQHPPTSTEHQKATQTPHPSRAPTSSAEVPPNADLPPPPPPPSTESVTKLFGDAPGSSTKFPYNATSSKSVVDISKLLENSAAAYARTNELANDPLSQAKVRTNPVIGKTVFVGSKDNRKGGHVAATPVAAFGVLDRVVRDQKVKTLARLQKFHERKGMMRKRLKMERWRRRFKEGFKATASRVLELKKQGW